MKNILEESISIVIALIFVAILLPIFYFFIYKPLQEAKKPENIIFKNVKVIEEERTGFLWLSKKLTIENGEVLCVNIGKGMSIDKGDIITVSKLGVIQTGFFNTEYLMNKCD